MEWQFAEAKNKLSEVFDRADTEGPQEVNRRGRPTMVIIKKDDLEISKKPKRDFKDFLLHRGLDLTGVDLERDRTPDREFEW